MTSTIAALIVLFAMAPALAQQGAEAPQGRQNRAARPGLAPAEVAEMIDAYALMQAEKQLDLRDAQFSDFVTRLKQLQQIRRRNLHARNQMLRELLRLTNPQRGEADENTLREKLKELREHDVRAAAELRKAYDALDEILDTRQQVRFRLFEEQLERRKLELLMRAQAGVAARPRTQP